MRSYGFVERHVTGPMNPKRIRRLDSIEDQIKLGLNPGMVIQDRTCLLFVRGLEEVSAKSGNLIASDPAPPLCSTRPDRRFLAAQTPGKDEPEVLPVPQNESASCRFEIADDLATASDTCPYQQLGSR